MSRKRDRERAATNHAKRLRMTSERTASWHVEPPKFYPERAPAPPPLSTSLFDVAAPLPAPPPVAPKPEQRTPGTLMLPRTASGARLNKRRRAAFRAQFARIS